MKRIFPALLAVLIFCASLAMAVPARAEFNNGHYKGWYKFAPKYEDGLINGIYDPSQLSLDFSDLIGAFYAYCYSDGTFGIGDIYTSPVGISYSYETYIEPVWNPDFNCWTLMGEVFSPFLFDVNGSIFSGATLVLYLYLDCDISSMGLVDAANFAKFMLAFEELPGNPFVEESSSANTIGVYPAIYDILADAFYGDGADLTGDQTLVLTVLATLAIVFMFAIPFLVVWLVIRIILGFFGDR